MPATFCLLLYPAWPKRPMKRPCKPPGAAEYFCRYDLPQYLSVLRAAMDTLDKVQQGAQAPEERS